LNDLKTLLWLQQAVREPGALALHPEGSRCILAHDLAEALPRLAQLVKRGCPVGQDSADHCASSR